MGPTFHGNPSGADAGAAGAAGGGGACAGVAEDESAGAGGGAGVCALAASAIAIAAAAMDRRITVVFECIDTIPPGKDLCMMGKATTADPELMHRRAAASEWHFPPENATFHRSEEST